MSKATHILRLEEKLGELEEGGGRNQRGDAEPGPWGWAGAGRTKGQS